MALSQLLKSIIENGLESNGINQFISPLPPFHSPLPPSSPLFPLLIHFPLFPSSSLLLFSLLFPLLVLFCLLFSVLLFPFPLFLFPSPSSPFPLLLFCLLPQQSIFSFSLPHLLAEGKPCPLVTIGDIPIHVLWTERTCLTLSLHGKVALMHLNGLDAILDHTVITSGC